MIAINSKADIFFYSKKKIYIFLTGKIIEIEDTDNYLASSFLRWLYAKQRGDLDGFINEMGKISWINELKRAIDNLVKIDVLVEATTFSTQQRKFIPPFIPFNFYQNIWGVRNGQKFFFLIASNRQESIKRVKEMALSWIDEVETGVIDGLLAGKIECLSAKIIIPDTNINNLNRNCILIYDSISRKFDVFKKKFPKKVKKINFWQELSKRAVGEIGIVPIIKRVLSKNGPFPLSINTFLSCHKLSSLRDRSDDWQIGRDEDLEIAKGKSIMEAIERYCGRKKLSEKNLIFSSMKRLGTNHCINPREIAAYSNLQFKKGWLKGITNFNENLKTNWTKVKNFKRNEFKFIPECFISYPKIDFYSEKIPRFFFANSSGVAAHTNINKAIEKAVLEIIERDAILIHWINRISPNKIIFSNKCPNFFLNVKRKLKLLGYQLAVLDLTLDTIPVVMSIAYKENGSFGFFSGAAAAKSRMEAIRRSIEELEFTVWARLKDLVSLRKEIKNINIKAIWRPSHHETIYLKPSMSSYLEFLYKGEEVKFTESDLNAEMEVFASVEKIGGEIYYIDLTTEAVQNLGLGIKVVRCIIPGFIPITFGYGYEPLAMKRIYDIPSKTGKVCKSLCERDVVENYLPHFFP